MTEFTIGVLGDNTPGLDNPDQGPPVKAQLHATALDHTAICVPDLDKACALFSEILGQPVAHRERVASQKVAVAFFDFPNGASLEMIAPDASLGGNPGLARFLEKRGAGLHHLALRVRDLDALLARLDAQGVPLLDKTGRPGARGHRVAFLHPAAFDGAVLLELVEQASDPGDERPSPGAGLP